MQTVRTAGHARLLRTATGALFCETGEYAMTFSIIVVCLNAGEKLHETVESILNQTEQDYEVIIKDGGSGDDATRACLERYGWQPDKERGLRSEGEAALREGPVDRRIRVYCGKDNGIYDGMNQALRFVRGEYVFFLNCGDRFYDGEVLARVKERIRETAGTGASPEERISADRQMSYIFYGNVYEGRTGTLIPSNPVIDDFACYRNLPCHQACFYSAALMRDRGFDTDYIVRADYEHFLWCYYEAHARTIYMPLTIAVYEGGGFSETRENEKRSKAEHRVVVSRYMPAGKVFRYRMFMLLTLAPLRAWIAKNPATAKVYQSVKKRLYKT